MGNEPRPARRGRVAAMVLAGALLVGVVGCNAGNAEEEGESANAQDGSVAAEAPDAQRARTEEPSDEAEDRAPARRVRMVRAESGVLTTTRTASVDVEPAQEAQVAASVSGQVAGILHREGDEVGAGQDVIVLDDENLRLDVENARFAVRTARLELQKARDTSPEAVRQAESAVRSARTNLELARDEYQQGQQLYERGAISRVELGNLQARFEQAQSNLEQAENALAQRRQAGNEDLELLQLQVEQAENQLARAERALDDARIEAPFAGQVVEVLVEEGEFIGAGSPAFRLASSEEQLARFQLPPEDARRLVERGLVHIRYDGLDHAAQVRRSSGLPGQSRLVEVTAEIYPSESRIPTGAVAELAYEIEVAEGTVLPSGAIRTSGGDTLVLTIEDGAAVATPVRLLGESGGQVVVRGLDDGARVVHPLPADLRAGTRVEVVTSERAP